MSEPRPALSLRRVLMVVLPVGILGFGAYLWSKTLVPAAQQEMTTDVLARMFTSDAALSDTSVSLPDKDGDMVADPPTDASKIIDPEVLVFSYVASEEESAPEEAWTELLKALSEKTGHEVKFVKFEAVDEQLDALQKGELHVAGLNTGIVPPAVQRNGFVPICTLGHEDGTFGYTMQFLVPADSPIKKLGDVKGHKVTFTRLDSNSGCKAPLVLLKDEHNLLPERDYDWGFSQGHVDSIKHIAANEFEVAPVASDVLARMVEKGEVEKAAYRSIYESERFPPATIGVAYNLKPELRDTIKTTLLEFNWDGTGLEKEFGPEVVKFVPVNYKNDWANIRRIDQVISQARSRKAI
ncbi:MAG: phosphate/phosphite/phosphonate ABC transporter substrate-binding protein [Planctomycetes bacterium]|nr:phosphate/phosphite/phosphonate ABC transporter substrate-binding protein [Planctomycetota bacterium]